MNPQDYFNHAISIIEAYSYYQPTIQDWESKKTAGTCKAREAETLAEIHCLIRDLLSGLDDRHSHLIVPDEIATEPNQPSTMPKGHFVEQWGYVMLPSAAGDDDMMQQYANLGHDLVRQMAHAKGWIVDLRENTGGNMWPMLAAIGGLAGEGILGYFVDRNAQKVAWGYRQGASFYDQGTVYEVSQPAQTISPEVPVAVLIGDRTVSSGEITLISFLGRENIRVFGQATKGVPTANDMYLLEDDALLVLTCAITADRHGKKYETKIAPDVVCEDALETAIHMMQKNSG